MYVMYLSIYIQYDHDHDAPIYINRCRHGGDRMVVGITTTYGISA